MRAYVFRSLSGGYGMSVDNDAARFPDSLAPWAFFKEIEVNEDDPPRIGVSKEELSVFLRDGYLLLQRDPDV